MSLRTIYHKTKTPQKLETNEYIKLLKGRVKPVTFNKMARVFDEQILIVNPSQKSSLSFAMLATLVGHNSQCPVGDANYIWETVWKAAKQHQRTANYMLGMLAQWRFALDERKWVCYSQETGKLNELGEEITRTFYFVDNDA